MKQWLPILAVLALMLLKNKKAGTTLSRAGLEHIKSEEQFSPTRYVLFGVPHIGYGHVIQEGETFPPIISEDEGEKLLFQDLKPAIQAINTYVSVPLTQNQFDALASFIYNVGPAAFAESTLLRLLNEGDYNQAAQEFGQWVKASINGEKQTVPGLVTRREFEKRMFLA